MQFSPILLFPMLSMLYNMAVVAMNPSTSGIDLNLLPNANNHLDLKPFKEAIYPINHVLKKELRTKYKVHYFAVKDDEIKTEIEKQLRRHQLMDVYFDTIHDVHGDADDGSFSSSKQHPSNFISKNNLYHFGTIPIFEKEFQLFGTHFKSFPNASKPQTEDRGMFILWTLAQVDFSGTVEPFKYVLILNAADNKYTYSGMVDGLSGFKFESLVKA